MATVPVDCYVVSDAAIDGSEWTVHVELLAANVVQLSWTRRDGEMSSAFSAVGDASTRVTLRSAGPNSTLEAVRLLNGSTTTCEDDDRLTSLLSDCDLTATTNSVMTSMCYRSFKLYCHSFKKLLSTTRVHPSLPSVILYFHTFDR